MLKLISFVKNHSEAIGAMVILIGISFFVRFKVSQTNKYGIITVAKATRYEGAESGSDLYIDIYLEGKIYKTSVDQGCQYNCVGNYFFVKVLKNDPSGYVTFYGDKQVPDCIIKNVTYFKGWQDIPTCEKY